MAKNMFRILIVFLALSGISVLPMEKNKAELGKDEWNWNLMSLTDLLALCIWGDLNDQLRTAITDGNLGMIQKLIEAGADVNAKYGTSSYPLMLAITCGRIEIIKYLIENGAKGNKEDWEGYTGLMHAARYGYQSCCELLVEKMLGTNPSEQACAAYFCMKNLPGNIFDGIKDPAYQRLCAPQYLGYERTLEEVKKIKNRVIRQWLMEKYFLDEKEK